MSTRERLGHLAACASLFEPWTGPFDLDTLSEWLAAELGHADALDQPVTHGPLHTQARAASRLLHVVSENTPHAAFQSLLRGLVVGSHNTVKLPSSGLPAFSAAVAELPAELTALVELVSELPAGWTERFDCAVLFGSDDTLAWFAKEAPARVRLILHGQKLSIALVRGDCAEAARLAARDVSQFDQRGCLSIHAVYLADHAGNSGPEFAALLATEMARYEQEHPRAEISLEAASAISSLREEVRFRSATDPAQTALWESVNSTAWTVIYESSPLLKLSPLNRVVYVKPWPMDDAAGALGAELRHLSTLALHPFDAGSGDSADLVALGPTRLCPLGETQNPSLFWHHDGLPPLASLVTWVDVG